MSITFGFNSLSGISNIPLSSTTLELGGVLPHGGSYNTSDIMNSFYNSFGAITIQIGSVAYILNHHSINGSLIGLGGSISLGSNAVLISTIPISIDASKISFFITGPSLNAEINTSVAIVNITLNFIRTVYDNQVKSVSQFHDIEIPAVSGYNYVNTILPSTYKFGEKCFVYDGIAYMSSDFTVGSRPSFCMVDGISHQLNPNQNLNSYYTFTIDGVSSSNPIIEFVNSSYDATFTSNLSKYNSVGQYVISYLYTSNPYITYNSTNYTSSLSKLTYWIIQKTIVHEVGNINIYSPLGTLTRNITVGGNPNPTVVAIDDGNDVTNTLTFVYPSDSAYPSGLSVSGVNPHYNTNYPLAGSYITQIFGKGISEVEVEVDYNVVIRDASGINITLNGPMPMLLSEYDYTDPLHPTIKTYYDYIEYGAKIYDTSGFNKKLTDLIEVEIMDQYGTVIATFYMNDFPSQFHVLDYGIEIPICDQFTVRYVLVNGASVYTTDRVIKKSIGQAPTIRSIP